MPPKPKPGRTVSRSRSADTTSTQSVGRTLRKIGDYYTAQDVSASGRGGMRQRKKVSAERIGAANRKGAAKVGAEGPKKAKPRNAQRNKYAR